MTTSSYITDLDKTIAALTPAATVALAAASAYNAAKIAVDARKSSNRAYDDKIAAEAIAEATVKARRESARMAAKKASDNLYAAKEAAAADPKNVKLSDAVRIAVEAEKEASEKLIMSERISIYSFSYVKDAIAKDTKAAYYWANAEAKAKQAAKAYDKARRAEHEAYIGDYQKL